MSGTVRNAADTDLSSIECLLGASALPVQGVCENLHDFFVYEEAGGAILGTVGLEVYAAAGLLRSTIVAESGRRRGVGTILVDRAVAHARDQGCDAIYLLTLDAENYFKRFGFKTVNRDEAPEAIRKSQEFTTLCPASAVLMHKTIKE